MKSGMYFNQVNGEFTRINGEQQNHIYSCESTEGQKKSGSKKNIRNSEKVNAKDQHQSIAESLAS